MAPVISRGLIEYGFPRLTWKRVIRANGALLRRAVLAVCLMAMPCLAPLFAAEAVEIPLLYQVKAVYLLKFTKFIEWPPETLGPPDSTFNICVAGTDSFVNALDQVVSGELVYGRKVTVQKVGREPAAASCRILFVGDAEEDPGALAGLGRGVLTVGDNETFVRNGGIIAFVIENHRVQFEINRTAAAAAGLRLSSQLLNVAKSVTK